jgi:hypothetical protein
VCIFGLELGAIKEIHYFESQSLILNRTVLILNLNKSNTLF